MTADAEMALVAQAGQGCETSFRKLVEPHLGLFCAGIRRILRDEQDAQDALQEALMNISAGLPSFLGSSRFSTWAYRICINEALMFRRSQQRRREDSYEDWLLPMAVNDHARIEGTRLLSQDAMALETIEQEQMQAEIKKALGDLSEEQRVIFVMRDLEDRDTQEVADLLGISRALVRQRLHRARLALRGSLEVFMTRLRP